MQREERFDSCYRAMRGALLHECFALTGDLATAQTAVRDAFVTAWHHWRKADAHGSPESWVRPRAWALAHRRHTARIWHRTKDLSDEQRTTLDALARIGYQQRRLLLLVELVGLTLPEAAREMGLTQDITRRRAQEAVSLFALQRDIAPSAVRAHLEDLAGVTSTVSLPRASAVRRAGRRRRHFHTLFAAMAAVGVTLGSGAIAYEPASGRAPGQATASQSPGTKHAPGGAAIGEAAASPALLDVDQIARLGTHQQWQVTPPDEVDIALDDQCRQAPFPDPHRRTGQVRAFRAAGRPDRVAVQRVEVSKSASSAQQAYATALAWYAQCEMGRLQLVDSYRVDGVGDAAAALRFRLWTHPTTGYWVALARVGAMTTSTVSATVAGSPPPARRVAQSLADSVTMLCGADGATSDQPGCHSQPALSAVPPPVQPAERGLLTAVDLPPVGQVSQPWVGTTPTVPHDNPAATACDRADFLGAGAVRASTRTFLVPGADLPTRFGLAETYGVFESPKAARRFLARMGHRVDHCQAHNLATTVHPGPGQPQARIWRLDTAVTAHRTVTFRLGFVRAGNVVAELTFAPAADADLSARRFRKLVDRAGERLRALAQ